MPGGGPSQGVAQEPRLTDYKVLCQQNEIVLTVTITVRSYFYSAAARYNTRRGA